YIAFEQVERDLSVKDARLVTKIEGAFAAVRERAEAKPAADELAVIREELARALDQAERQLGATLTPVSLFTQSFLILFREGLEAILVVGALMAFLVKAGARERRREIHLGVLAAIALSLLTAVALKTVLTVSPARQEAMEGVTLAVATVMLFYVSYWLLSKMEVAKWNHFVKGRMASALTGRSAFALAAVAFLAVYREGFETVFFYEALALSGGSGAAWPPILAGIAVGGLVLGVVYVAINRWGMRLPLRPFFAGTSLFLYVMAFVFAGKAVAELQEGGLLSLTSVSGGPRVPSLGIYPTVESLGAQLILLLLALIALLWTFVIQPRRIAPVGQATPVPRDSAGRPPLAAPARDKAPLKSIDRIEADLAAVRAELERMRDAVEQDGGAAVRRHSAE
ncbi:MAG: FTR1 family protein, partial [Gemmatimonadota bacterium]